MHYPPVPRARYGAGCTVASAAAPLTVYPPLALLAVLETVQELVVGTNAYIERTGVELGVNRQLITAVATYITRIFDIFGLISTEEALEETLVRGLARAWCAAWPGR